jgi:hypothetical protein
MGDGSFVEGAQGVVDVSWPPDMLQALRDNPVRLRRMAGAQWIFFGTPWLMKKEQFQASLIPDQILQRLAARHPGVFARQGTSSSHPPHVPSLIGIADINDILNLSVGTDPTLATQTRRGTGFYKVPSLRGVWFRNAFGHGGQAETLEEWLNPERLKENYVPKGFHLGPGPIKGHQFGINLDSEDRDSLIAFSEDVVARGHQKPSSFADGAPGASYGEPAGTTGTRQNRQRSSENVFF